MARVRLLHWKREEAEEHFVALRAAGYRVVEYDEQYSPALLKNWRESPPSVFVVDLSRLPSQGREIAIALRQSPKTRLIPIVFCQGNDEKIERIRKELPDAFYCSLSGLAAMVRKATAHPPAEPVKPVQMMNRYGSRTVAQKLGISAGSKVLLINPPQDVNKVLSDLPAGAEFVEDDSVSADVTLCFIHGADMLAQMLSSVRKLAAKTKLWILWRKGGSKVKGGVTENMIRDHALPLGLVDYKICAVNEVWSAILFAHKQ